MLLRFTLYILFFHLLHYSHIQIKCERDKKKKPVSIPFYGTAFIRRLHSPSFFLQVSIGFIILNYYLLIIILAMFNLLSFVCLFLFCAYQNPSPMRLISVETVVLAP